MRVDAYMMREYNMHVRHLRVTNNVSIIKVSYTSCGKSICIS